MGASCGDAAVTAEGGSDRAAGKGQVEFSLFDVSR
jgi:hypothetical protein